MWCEMNEEEYLYQIALWQDLSLLTCMYVCMYAYEYDRLIVEGESKEKGVGNLKKGNHETVSLVAKRRKSWIRELILNA